ncbi:GNAT family N-acetyltransferase [Carboxylicivirga sp. N1Y90]|uniref:GNAT family N-acetyltransferase n=1 Tax=Carboxylicivirga fragile TaxID=3417571 RepID=UPI003D32EFCD|nr:GNAT family N-acetyltransferase [Marinilabiliaceae bacterium N1Y90]
MKKQTIQQSCYFTTKRLSVEGWAKHKSSETVFAQSVIDILSPKVTQSLPDGWQNIDSISKALQWLKDRDADSHFLSVTLSGSGNIIGYIFIYETELATKPYELRFGYLLAEPFWGQGLGTELIHGLLLWCEAIGDIKSISGGVEKHNIGSIKVLEKTGFTLSEEKGPSDQVVFYQYEFKQL